jgi:hypothetical protein
MSDPEVTLSRDYEADSSLGVPVVEIDGEVAFENWAHVEYEGDPYLLGIRPDHDEGDELVLIEAEDRASVSASSTRVSLTRDEFASAYGDSLVARTDDSVTAPTSYRDAEWYEEGNPEEEGRESGGSES